MYNHTIKQIEQSNIHMEGAASHMEKNISVVLPFRESDRL